MSDSSFLTIVDELDEGKLRKDIDQALKECAAACLKANATGNVRVQLTIKPVREGEEVEKYVIHGRVTSSPPPPPREKYYVDIDKKGKLTRVDGQLSLPGMGDEDEAQAA